MNYPLCRCITSSVMVYCHRGDYLKNAQVMLTCDICGTAFKRKPSQIGQLNYCTKACANIAKAKAAYSKMCNNVGRDFKEWLCYEYLTNKRSIRNIAQEAYGNAKNSSSILRWLNQFGVQLRQGGEAVKTQWEGNNQRRIAASRTMKRTMTPELRERITEAMQTPEYKEKQSKTKQGERNGMYGVIGENSPKWNPERTHEQRVKERKTNHDRDWRLAVFQRDGYTCTVCGDSRGGNLVAHHIESYAKAKEKRYDVDNGATLCKTCHHALHANHGWRNASRQDLEQFKATHAKQTA